MHFLRSILFYFIVFTIVFFSSCKPQGSLTAEDALYDLKQSYKTSDYNRLQNILSENCIYKIKLVVSQFSRMEDDQLKNLSRLYDVPVEKLKKLGVNDYIVWFFSSRNKNNMIAKALQLNIVSIEWEGSNATIRVENGFELSFKKEGPYWKFDMEL